MMTTRVRHALGLLAALLFAPTTSYAIAFAWPIECKLGETCFIQNYVEHASSNQDFACDGGTFPGLTGTDIRIRSLSAMRAGVAVKAAADGTVLGTRDNVADISIREENAPHVKGIECGNGVRVQHEEGYTTQYCHLRKGSIRVHTGDKVKTGDVLGMVGLSGETEFPHLHFNVMKGKDHIDPFTSDPASVVCNADLVGRATQLWATPVPYWFTTLLNDGVADHQPDRTAMLDTPVSLSTMPPNAYAFVYWVEVMNVKEGDSMNLTITAPDGSIFAQENAIMRKSQAAYFKYIGKKNSSGTFATGIYHPRITITRQGTTVLDVTRDVEIK